MDRSKTVEPGRSVLLVGNHLSVVRGNRAVGEDLAERLTASGWDVITTSNKPVRLTRLADMIGTAWTKRGQYDVAQVDVFSGPAFIWAELVCLTLRRAGKPYILTLHGGNLPAYARRWPRRVRRLLQSATCVTAPSRYLLEHMRPCREDLVFLPNPLDVKQYSFLPREKPRPRLVWLRAFHSIYNPVMVPDVVLQLCEAFPDVQLTMIGPDKGDGSLQFTRRRAEENGVLAHITFPGGVPKSEVPQNLQRGDIFLNTTNVDNTPVSVLEAMACGLCVVSTNVGGIPYLLEHEHDALLVPPEDPEAMAAAIRRLLTDPGLAERLSCNARKKVEQFDWSVVLPQWEELLSSVVARGLD